MRLKGNEELVRGNSKTTQKSSIYKENYINLISKEGKF